ncbi:MAG: radical SAM protein [Smithellaceae bacterium]|nr:radical SAM protein [Syntrophaceae bacterium]MDD4241180.1 radical SAM protein [Smithellaceae bacterium]NLX51540.1 radical SAM protein [Deltaproteobacteria bacterium]
MNWKQKQKYEALLSRERGVVKKVWGTGHTVCLAYPNAYRIGMANLGFQTVYRLFNDLPSFLCERAFWPSAGGGAESAAGRAPLVSLESQKPLADFDILAFSLSFENDYSAVLQMLEAAGIPLAAEDRDLTHPLVMGGGIAPTLNPEPLAAFFDVFLLGEAEEILPAFARLYAATAGLARRDRLIALQTQLPGVYVPALYEVSYFPEGPVRRMTPLADGLPETIRIERVRNIDAFCTTQTVSSPDSEMADMCLVEVNRGCPHLCRFCAAGHVYAPPRFRAYDEIVKAVDRGLALKGKIGLVGTAVSDHPDLADLCRHIVARGAAVGVGSLRVDRITGEMLDLLKAGGVETVALAPEAGSQRLRDLLRKEITAADILDAARLLIEKDILNLRLYFMVGLPTEEDGDIDAIIDLARKIQHTALAHTAGRKKFRRITLSVNQFIPKPRTPLQWCALADVQDVHRRIQKIVSAFRRDRQIAVLKDVPKWNFVQALLSLGDRRVGDILLAVHRRGGHWMKALREVAVNPDFYVYRQKALQEFLPWDIVDVGLPKKALMREYRKAFPDLP